MVFDLDKLSSEDSYGYNGVHCSICFSHVSMQRRNLGVSTTRLIESSVACWATVTELVAENNFQDKKKIKEMPCYK